MSQLENYNRLTNISDIEELYDKFSLKESNHRYELQLLESLKKRIFFESLTDLEKVDFRLRELQKKKIFKDIYSELEVKYESRVIDLSKAIISFLNETEEDLFHYKKEKSFTNIELAFIRLNTMCKIELIGLNKHIYLKNGGHVLYYEIIEPLFMELENSDYFQKYNLDTLKNIYKDVQDLYNKKPYSKL